jgi:hemoglobin-like flavoprotein
MNQNAVRMVQESWSRVEDIGPVAVELFQRNLMDSRPWLTAPYTGYVDDWGTMVLQTLGQALRGMHALGTHSSLLMQIGRVNASCGVQSHHYPCFEVALLQTLGHLLGAEFSKPLKEAWIAVLGTMRRLMLAGANREPMAAIAIRQHATDRRRQRRRAAHDLGGNRGYHRRAGQETNRRFLHPHVTHRAAGVQSSADTRRHGCR